MADQCYSFRKSNAIKRRHVPLFRSRSVESVLKAPVEAKRPKYSSKEPPKPGSSSAGAVPDASKNAEMTLGWRLMILQNQKPCRPSPDDKVWKSKPTFPIPPKSNPKRNVQSPCDAAAAALLNVLVDIVKPVIPPLREKFTCSTCWVEMFVDDGRIRCFDPAAADGANGSTDAANSNHSICIDCVRRYAAAVVEDGPLAGGGIGLCCSAHGCNNVFLASEFMMYLSEELHVRLAKRMQHESIMKAGLPDLMTCPCGFQMVVAQYWAYFDCRDCGRRQCRHCHRKFDEEHLGVSCEFLEDQDAESDYLRRIGPALNEVVVRVCPNCRLQCIKDEGCNYMTCRCGTQFCYLCRQQLGANPHFCECGHRSDLDSPCPMCGLTCSSGTSAVAYDDVRLRALKARFRSNHPSPHPDGRK